MHRVPSADVATTYAHDPVHRQQNDTANGASSKDDVVYVFVHVEAGGCPLSSSQDLTSASRPRARQRTATKQLSCRSAPRRFGGAVHRVESGHRGGGRFCRRRRRQRVAGFGQVEAVCPSKRSSGRNRTSSSSRSAVERSAVRRRVLHAERERPRLIRPRPGGAPARTPLRFALAAALDAGAAVSGHRRPQGDLIAVRAHAVQAARWPHRRPSTWEDGIVHVIRDADSQSARWRRASGRRYRGGPRPGSRAGGAPKFAVGLEGRRSARARSTPALPSPTVTCGSRTMAARRAGLFLRHDQGARSDRDGHSLAVVTPEANAELRSSITGPSTIRPTG